MKEIEAECIEEEVDEQDSSTQFLQRQKRQPTDFQNHSIKHRNVLPIFGCNSAKKAKMFLKNSYLLPFFVYEQEFQPIVINKANRFVSFKFGVSVFFQLLDILKFLGRAMRLDSFLKAYKTSETEIMFHLKSSLIHKTLTLLNLLVLKPSSANCVAKLRLKKTIQTFKNLELVV